MVAESAPAACEIEPLITPPGLHRSDEVILRGRGSVAHAAFPPPRSEFISRTLPSLISIFMSQTLRLLSTFLSLLPLKTHNSEFLKC